eukprot:CAMPEP_0173115056 /NCGR_PEP_ID=MMETSP1102-20130122/48117_1 /TAXON_ID=49646 /ORGANISM="Geminigera sp., Strain Caron Lab Isolate" /LENGTH=212 /DNA_ID=CAMNT_0014017707 /DNA_START=249 /DNA_END=887 /DNA_ORIENTATION=+
MDSSQSLCSDTVSEPLNCLENANAPGEVICLDNDNAHGELICRDSANTPGELTFLHNATAPGELLGVDGAVCATFCVALDTTAAGRAAIKRPPLINQWCESSIIPACVGEPTSGVLRSRGESEMVRVGMALVRRDKRLFLGDGVPERGLSCASRLRLSIIALSDNDFLRTPAHFSWAKCFIFFALAISSSCIWALITLRPDSSLPWERFSRI